MATTKRKRISVSAFEKIMKGIYNPTEVIEWQGVEITIKQTLSLVEMMNFVDSVTKSCFTSDDNKYVPEIKDFAIRCCVLEMYANFAMPTNIERKYELVYCTDAFDVVVRHINACQFNEILNAIDDKVDNIAQANIEAVHRQMNELYMALNGMQEQISNIFSGIGSGEMAKIVDAIAGGRFDEDKLVQAYINQTRPETDSQPIESEVSENIKPSTENGTDTDGE